MERVRLAGCRGCLAGDRPGLARHCCRHSGLVARVIWTRAPLVTSRSSALPLRSLPAPAHTRAAPRARRPGIQNPLARLLARTKCSESASAAARLPRTRGGQMGRKRPGLRQEQYDRGVRDGLAGRNRPPHAFWRVLASHLGLMDELACKSVRLDNNAYRAGWKLGRSRRGSAEAPAVGLSRR